MVSIQFTLTDFEQPSCLKHPDPWSIALTLAVDPDVTLQRHRRWSRDLHRDTPPSTPVLLSRDSLFQTNSTLNLPLAPFWHKQDGGRFASTHPARQSKTRGPEAPPATNQSETDSAASYLAMVPSGHQSDFANKRPSSLTCLDRM